MRILIYTGAYSLMNMGDVAMLQTTVKRLRELYPAVELMVPTASPKLLVRYCPGTRPVLSYSIEDYYCGSRSGQLDWGETWMRMKRRWQSIPSRIKEFRESFDSAEIVSVSGGGFLNDLNHHQTRSVFRMIADASHLGKRVALFSQGLGPLESPDLLNLLRLACRSNVGVAIREGLHGPTILAKAYAQPGYSSITGDDAIEMAWQKGSANQGNSLGFSIRQVGYSGVKVKHLETLAFTLQTLTKKLGTTVVSLPVSLNDHERDHEVIGHVLRAKTTPNVMDAPEYLIDAVAECRVLLTGTYHPAVFALARGIPCVLFYASAYYRNKMEGLASQFPGGCELVDLSGAESGKSMINAVIRFWEIAGPQLGAKLRKFAGTQVESGKRFYRRAFKVE